MSGKILAAWRHASVRGAVVRLYPRRPSAGTASTGAPPWVDCDRDERSGRYYAYPSRTDHPLPGLDPHLRYDKGRPVLHTPLTALKSSGVNYLITGVKDLLALADRYSVVTPAEFWEAHGGV